MRKRLFIFCLLTVSCAHQPTQQDLSSWRGKMRALAISISDSLPYALNASEFYNPENRQRISQGMKEVASLARDIDKEHFAQSGDPNLKFVSERFAQDMTEMARQFEEGSRRMARMTMLNATNYCVSCHTRSEAGHENIGLGWNPKWTKFSKLDQALFLVAIRQYDQGLKLAYQVLTDKTADNADPRQWQTLAERSLAVSIRVAQDPQLTRKFLDAIRANPKSPQYMQSEMKSWQQAVKEWESDSSIPKMPMTSMGPVVKLSSPMRRKLFNGAKTLILKGEKIAGATDDAGFIYYLRASSLLHRLLSDPKQDWIRGGAMYLAGRTAGHLRELNLWSTQEDYFESCIRYQPYTALARLCYNNLEKSILSTLDREEDVVFMSSSIKGRLSALKPLSGPEPDRQAEKNIINDWQVVDQYVSQPPKNK